MNEFISNNIIDSEIIPYEKKINGKVRDVYYYKNHIILITTDRLSAFDRILTYIPHKGQVLNLISKWWFEKTKHIVDNHIILCPHPNVLICKKCTVFPIEFVMRGYITGSTKTSIWTHYKNGSRRYCGHILPDNMKKNQSFGNKKYLLTPTTKDIHDVPISIDEIIETGKMTKEDVLKCQEYAHKLFSYGVEEASKHNMILVDTKYEFGKDDNGNIILVDEIHTPDSSRYWIKNTYQQCMDQGKEPDNIDKEFIRKWYVEQCNPYNDKQLPKIPTNMIETLSKRYISLYEKITGEQFSPNYLNINNNTMNEIKNTIIY